MTATSGGGLIWKDLLKYNDRFKVNYFNSLVIANADVFAALAAPVQTALRSAVADAMPWITQQMATQEDDWTKEMQAGGLVVTAEDPDDVASAAKLFEPYWARWAKTKGPEAAEALTMVRSALGR